ncbi:MAG TPA: hypothetical protein VFO59_02730 [Dehalococcoidia bacterium]|nr:hypothetical protein [Dehalococcoidia bacterium]
MPRKYHRPPTTKRRKTRKASPYTFEGAPEPDETEDTELAASAEELDEEDWPGEARVAAAPEETRQKGRAVQHLVKDHSYVRGEVARIVALGVFIIVSLLITALLRN